MNTEQGAVVHIVICMGSSCFSRGNNHTLKILKDHIVRNSLEDRVTLAGSLCEGRCNEGPNMTVDGIIYNHVDRSTVVDILEHHLRLSSKTTPST